MGKTPQVVLDTRFLFALPYLEGEARRKGIAFHESIRSGKTTAIVPTIVLTELFELNSREFGKETAHIRSRSAALTYQLHELDADTAVEAGMILSRHKVPIADSIISATYKVMEAEYVMTDDPHFNSIGVRTRWITDL